MLTVAALNAPAQDQSAEKVRLQPVMRAGVQTGASAMEKVRLEPVLSKAAEGPKIAEVAPDAQVAEVVYEADSQAVEASPAPAGQDPPPARHAVSQPADLEPVLRLHAGQSTAVRAPWRLRRASVADPKVADIHVVSPTEALVLGKAPGTTDLTLWSEDERTWTRRVEVAMDLERLKTDLAGFFPRSRLNVTESQGVYVITGQLDRVEEVDNLHRYIKQIGDLQEAGNQGDSNKSGVKFVDMTTVAGVQQVQLQVRVAEVSRTALRSLGVNIFYFGEDVALASSPGSASSFALNFDKGISGITAPSVITSLAAFRNADLAALLEALTDNEYVRVLAEPTLVALSGQEAKFLAGGSFPVPVVQSTGNAAGSITIEWKDFGVQLVFTPTVLGDGAIRLKVAPEVSELSDSGAVVLQGFRIPALSVRKAETMLNIKSGQTFAMAGLMRNNTSARSLSLPGLGNIPVLGALFRSVRYEKGETELMVLVTPTLVEPLSLAGKPALPGEEHVTPNAWDLYFMGKLEGGCAPKVSEAQARTPRAQKLKELKGPGSWSSYEPQMAQGAPTAELTAEEKDFHGPK